MTVLTVVNLVGDSSRVGITPDASVVLRDILKLTDLVVRREDDGAWLLLESRKPLDPAQLKDNLAEWGIFPTIWGEVTYERTSDGRRHVTRWQSNDRSLPNILRDEDFIWNNAMGGVRAGTNSSGSSSQTGISQFRVSIELEPILYHRLSIAALENGQTLDEYIMEVLEERADG